MATRKKTEATGVESPFPGDAFVSDKEPFSGEWVNERNEWARKVAEEAAKAEGEAYVAEEARARKNSDAGRG